MRYQYPFRIVAFVFGLCAIACTVRAQEPPPACGERAQLLDGLASEEWGETIDRRGLEGNGEAMVEITANLATGTWTILRTMPGGPTCIMAVGKAWEALSEPEPGEGL